MAFRIETLEQLQDARLVEQVTDRLRRTTQPRKFIFKVRCKALDGNPVLLSAPPGRKVKSSLVRQLRLGTPTLRGVVHREGKVLYFTFTTEVNRKQVQRWIAHFLHKAKSPVPIHNIVILCPSDKNTAESNQPSTSREEPTSSTVNEPPLRSRSVVEVNWNREEDEELSDELNFEERQEALKSKDDMDRIDAIQDEMSLLDQLLENHVDKAALQRLQQLRLSMEEQQERVEELLERASNLNADNTNIQEELNRIQRLMDQEKAKQSGDHWERQLQAWRSLENEIKASDLTLDTLRDILISSALPVESLQKELQFIEDDWDAFKAIREFCAVQCDEVEQDQADSPRKLQQHQADFEAQEILHAQNRERQQATAEKLVRNQKRLEEKETLYWKEQTALLQETARSMLQSDESNVDALVAKLKSSGEQTQIELAVALQQLSTL